MNALLHWTPRVLSAAILLFWGFFLVASIFGDAARPSRPLVLADYLILGTLLVSLAGLLLAWRWEAAGAAVTLVAVSFCAMLNWRVVVFPGTLIPITALLFLLSWWRYRPLAH